MSKNLKLFTIAKTARIRDALKQLGSGPEKVLFVVDGEGRFLGTLSDGDIRRKILDGRPLDGTVEDIYNRNPYSAQEGCDAAVVRKAMAERHYIAVPVLGADGRVVDVLSWKDVFGVERRKEKGLDLPVVIMAGGRGTRMEPFTKILPKPLVPIGEKTLIEIIMDNFAEYGVKRFYVTLNYKGEMVKAYFDNSSVEHELNYVWEKTPLGTAGGLGLLPKDAGRSFFVTNCDIMIKADYNDILRRHRDNRSDITVICSVRHFEIPYGVVRMGKGGILEGMAEKPEYDFIVNTGMYLVERTALGCIPPDRPFDMPDLLAAVRERGGRVFVYPVNQESWIDLGQWEEYRLHLKNLDVI